MRSIGDFGPNDSRANRAPVQRCRVHPAYQAVARMVLADLLISRSVWSGRPFTPYPALIGGQVRSINISLMTKLLA
jgi:hypothetical protein